MFHPRNPLVPPLCFLCLVIVWSCFMYQLPSNCDSCFLLYLGSSRELNKLFLLAIRLGLETDGYFWGLSTRLIESGKLLDFNQAGCGIEPTTCWSWSRHRAPQPPHRGHSLNVRIIEPFQPFSWILLWCLCSFSSRCQAHQLRGVPQLQDHLPTLRGPLLLHLRRGLRQQPLLPRSHSQLRRGHFF